MWDEMRQAHLAGQRPSEEFVQSVQHLPPLGRAEAWLNYVVDRGRSGYSVYGTQEAIVYLVSRGHDCTSITKDLVAAWKRDERHLIESRMQGVRVERWPSATGEPGAVLWEGLTYEEASDILHVPPDRIRDFWPDFDPLSTDSAMLRTVQWCGVGGFDGWWRRLAKLTYEMAVRGGLDPLFASFYLFNLCRSDHALELMPRALGRILEAIEIPAHPESRPWRRWKWTDTPRPTDNFSYAASIVFAEERIGSLLGNAGLADRASEALLRHQDSQGYWRHWGDDEEPSIGTTAMAVHALALRQPTGWELAASAALDWLWSVQDLSGCWIDFGFPHSVSLTVLVLDALELAAGGTRITFEIAAPTCDTEGGQDTALPEIKSLIDEIRLSLETGLDDLKQGQAAIYQRIGDEYRVVLRSISEEVHQGRIEQGQLQRTVDSIRLALRRIQDVGLPVDEGLAEALGHIHRTLNSSDMTVQQKFELSIPIVPLLLQYKVELGAGIDLDAVWEELLRRIRRKTAA